MSSVEVAPVRVAIVNDYEVVVRGVIGMLHPFRDRVVVVEGSAGLPPFHDVDIVLFDTFSRVSGNGVDQAFMLSVGATKVVVFAWSVQPEAVAQAFAQGATGYLSKGLDAISLVEALEAVHRGEIITLLDVGWAAGRSEGDWPGRTAGLSPREAEILAYLVQGLTRQEIADGLFVSINTVKTQLASVYRKIGVGGVETRHGRGGGSRSQAVQWAIENGFAIEPKRLVNPIGRD
jgi:DNA-binding NarL/FixJ family response regulator